MLRILHVAALPFPTHQGTQVYIRQLCERQARSGHEVHLVTYAGGLDGRGDGIFAHHRSPDVPRFRSMRSGPAWQKPLLDLGLAATARGLAGRLGPDIVHAHHYEGLAAGLAAAGGRLPVVYHAHTLLEPELPCYYDGRAMRSIASISGLCIDRVLPRAADHCLAVSPHVCEILLGHGVPDDRVTYVPPSVDLEHMPRGERAVPGPDPTLVYLGNLDRYQGVDGMIRAFDAVRRARPGLRLRIVTDSDPSPCRALADSLGLDGDVSVEPHGDFGTVIPRLRSAHVALAPRCIPGGFPIKLLNYLHGGVPVVASVHASGGLRHGIEAMVYSTHAQMIEHVSTLLADAGMARRIARKGRRFAREHFSWDVAMGLIDGVYEGLLRRRSRDLRLNSIRMGTPAKSQASRNLFSR